MKVEDRIRSGLRRWKKEDRKIWIIIKNQ